MTAATQRRAKDMSSHIPGRLRVPMLVAFLALVVATVVGFARPDATSAATDITWNRYDVDITINEDGTFHIVESQVVRFSGSYGSGFASIPLGRVESIDNVTVEVGNSQSTLTEAEFVRPSRFDGDNGTYTTFEQDGNLEIEYGFERTEYYGTSTRYINLSYDVTGGLRSYPNLEPPNQQLWWIAISDEVTAIAPIESSTVTVTLPETVAPENLILDPESATVSGNTITWEQQDLGEGDDFEVRAQFPVITTAGVPEWQEKDDKLRQEREEAEERRALAGTFLFAAGLLLFVVGGVAIAGIWYTFGRDPHVGLVAEYLTEPPDDLGPGAAGALIDEYTQVRDIVATMVDLANRGVIELQLDESEDKSVFKRTTTYVALKEHKETLRPYEEKLLDAIFVEEVRPGAKTTLENVQSTFASYAEPINEAFYQTVVEHGYFSQSPESTRDRWKTIFRLVPVAGIAVAILIVVLVGGYSNWIFFPIVTAVILAFLSRGLANSMPKKTREGADAAAKWLAFKRYLEDIDKRENLEESKDIFQKYIAYAVAFGLEHSWVEKFTSVDTPVPDWWSPVLTGPQAGWGRQQYPRRIYRRQGMPAGGDWVFGERSGKRGGFDLDLPDLQDTSDRAGRGLQAASSGFFEMLSTAAEAMAESSSKGGGGSFGSSRGGGFSGGGGRSSGGGGGGGSRGFR